MSLRPLRDQLASEDEDWERTAAFRRFSVTAYAGRAVSASNMDALRVGFEEGWKAARGAWRSPITAADISRAADAKPLGRFGCKTKNVRTQEISDEPVSRYHAHEPRLRRPRHD